MDKQPNMNKATQPLRLLVRLETVYLEWQSGALVQVTTPLSAECPQIDATQMSDQVQIGECTWPVDGRLILYTLLPRGQSQVVYRPFGDGEQKMPLSFAETCREALGPEIADSLVQASQQFAGRLARYAFCPAGLFAPDGRTLVLEPVDQLDVPLEERVVLGFVIDRRDAMAWGAADNAAEP